MTDEVIGLFPVPLLRAPGALPQPLVGALVDHFSTQALQANNSSEALSHTRMLQPSDSPLLVQAAALITPKIAELGRLLFGENLGWAIKEMWVNVLDTGGRQAMHNHANSFASGVVYLTETDDSARTVFMKSPGGHDFALKNDHAGVVTGPYNAEKWVSPAPSPGDLVLFPSYLMHAVPPNAGGRRISLAFNAIPTRLESWGYTLSFNA
ncbi:MAG: hypothetical protein HY020_22450 [Burkholderiales bacterium]|nr:hypothetical protein [Burkholderiales bacterium]